MAAEDENDKIRLFICYSLVLISPMQFISYSKKPINPNKLHHPSQHIHQLLKLLFAPMILIPIHEAHRIKHKVDMGNLRILVDGIGDLVALA